MIRLKQIFVPFVDAKFSSNHQAENLHIKKKLKKHM